ncbi:Histone-lysine N-methyltransferase SETMAR, partial [Habropoda laboriosa]
YDNARPHISQITVQKLNYLKYETLLHPLYSPDLSPTDYHFCYHLDHFLGEKSFTNQANIESTFKEFTDTRTARFYENGIKKLVTRWQKYVDCNGSYFD